MRANIIPSLQPATETDADAVADVYLRSRKQLVACAPLVHTEQDVREWVRARLIRERNVTLAVLDGVVAGFCGVAQGSEYSWIEQLYVDPLYIRGGIGTLLLDRARDELKPPIRLYTFQCNAAARQFYEHHGFKAIKYSDGSSSEERCPDVLYEWRRD